MATAAEAAAFAALSRTGCSALEAAGAILLSREVELAEAWTHELRGKGGRWVKNQPLLSPALAHQTGLVVEPQRDPAVAAMREKPATLGQLAHAQEQTAAIARESAHSAAQKAAAQVLHVHENYVKEHEAADKAVEKHKAWLKFFGVMSTTIVGGIAAYVEARTGVPDAMQIATAISPIAAESLFELKKKL